MKNPERVRTYGSLRGEILRGEWTYDQARSEREIAERDQRPRQVVREALAVLEATGLVAQIPSTGVQVHQHMIVDARQSLRLRNGMETEIAEECARARKPVSSELYETLGDMATALHQGEQIEYMLADTRFHVGLVRHGGFSSSLTALEGMRDRIHLYRLHNECLPTKQHMLATLNEHTSVLTAIEGGDPQVAREAMLDHLTATLDRIEG